MASRDEWAQPTARKWLLAGDFFACLLYAPVRSYEFRAALRQAPLDTLQRTLAVVKGWSSRYPMKTRQALLERYIKKAEAQHGS